MINRFNYITVFIIGLLFISVSVMSEEKKLSLFKRGEKYFFTKKYEMAELLLQEEIKKNPENGLAYSYLGDIFLFKKKYNGAINIYKKAINLNKDLATNYYRLGQIYYYKKLGQLSINNYRKSLSIDEKNKFIHYQIGLSNLMLLRDKNKTIENWETYLKIAPENPQYEKIRRVLELLKDPNFIIPPIGSDVSIEEALLLGGATLKKTENKIKDKKADHEKMKTKDKMEGLYLDDDM